MHVTIVYQCQMRGAWRRSRLSLVIVAAVAAAAAAAAAVAATNTTAAAVVPAVAAVTPGNAGRKRHQETMRVKMTI
jgi:Spy/CpxP family protein refolding chaperone